MTHIVEKKRIGPRLLELLQKRAAEIIALTSITLLLIACVVFAGYVGFSRVEKSYEISSRV